MILEKGTHIDDHGDEILVYYVDGRGGYAYFLTSDLKKPAPNGLGGVKPVTLIEDVKADPRMKHIKKMLEDWEVLNP